MKWLTDFLFPAATTWWQTIFAVTGAFCCLAVVVFWLFVIFRAIFKPKKHRQTKQPKRKAKKSIRRKR